MERTHGEELRIQKLIARNQSGTKSQESFLSRAAEKHGDRYDYIKTMFKGIRHRVTITCKVHGDFDQMAQAHIVNGQGCPVCFKESRNIIPDFETKAREIHGDRYDYHTVDFMKKVDGKVTIRCKEHGDFLCKPSNHINPDKRQGCKYCHGTWVDGTKMVRGIGIYQPGKFSCTKSKEYSIWSGMLGRCDPNGRTWRLHPAYIGCSVHPDFIQYQDFAEWCQHQVGFGNEGWHLDKDILVQGNKEYGPNTCCFVPSELNALFTYSQNRGDNEFIGVCYHKTKGKYGATVSIDGIHKHLGYFLDPETASNAYIEAKQAEIIRQADIWKDKIDQRVYMAMIDHVVAAKYPQN